MRLGPADACRWVAARISLTGVDPLAGSQVWGEPDVYWERPQACEAVAGWGVAGVLEAASVEQVHRVLHMLSASDGVIWQEGPPKALPGPWFGGMRFATSGMTRPGVPLASGAGRCPRCWCGARGRG